MSRSDRDNNRAQQADTWEVLSTEALDKMRQQIDRLFELLVHGRSGMAPCSETEYVEPGPHSRRKFFTPEELMERWKWGKTKVYEIPENELPFWKKGQLKRYFWAHVWAYEGHISREQAEMIYAVQTSKLEILSHSQTKPTRLR